MSESQSKGEISSGEDVNVGQFVSKSRLVTCESAFFVNKLVEVFQKERKANQRLKVSRLYDRAAEISSFHEEKYLHILRQVTTEDWRKAELHCIKKEDCLMNIDLQRKQRAEEEATQALDEDQNDDYVPNSSKNEDNDNSFFSDNSWLDDVLNE